MQANHTGIVFTLLIALLSGCIRTTDDTTIDKSPTDISDDYSSIDVRNFTPSSIHIMLQDDLGSALRGIKVVLWDKSPVDGGQIIFKAITNENGRIDANYNIPNHLESVVLQTGYLGLPDYLIIPVDQVDEIVIKGFDHAFTSLAEELIPGQSPVETNNTGRTNGRVAAANYEYLGSYNSKGTPDYLMDRDVITSTLLEFVNASLPEGKPVPDFHPAYLSEGSETSLSIVEKADVFMTFLTEGAGYKNALGFYTYPTDNPPATANDIETLHIGFPNASEGGYGGELRPGDKIKLGTFEAGTSIGFVLIANGWNGTEVGSGINKHYSDTHLNTHEREDLMQHTVLLWDDVNELFLMGFEDQTRTKGSDNDFNDAVFYITSNPIEAINRENINPIDKPVDADNDGVNDTYDEFPNDPRYAYEYSYPGENSYGTFAFEDQWPGYGDYDFNDLVVDYQYAQRANSQNKMVLLQSEFVLKATGAGFHNGFGIQLDTDPTTISSISGHKIFDNFLKFNANGTEADQSKAVIIATDNAHDCFGANGLINTEPSKEFFTPDTIRVAVHFDNPVSLNAVGSAPFNPFIIIDKTRGRELHLPGYTPTDLVDTNYFGQGNDASDAVNGVYYKSQKGLPWGMNLPESFDYPMEKTDIRSTYTHFDTWAVSGGFSYMDWFTNKSGYRNIDKIYKK